METTAAASGSTGIVALERLAAEVDRVLGEFFDVDSFATATDDETVRAMTVAGAMLRRVEGVLIDGTAEMSARSSSGDPLQNLAVKSGCHNVSELVQRVTRVSSRTVGAWQRAAKVVHRDTSITTGELLPPVLPAMREAMVDGHVGVDGLLAVVGPLSGPARRVPSDVLRAADDVLAETARGDGPDAAPAPCADVLRIHATAWATVLDQDGSEPRDREAKYRRGLTIGAAKDGLVPIRGRLLPEVAAQLQRIIDALCSPRVEGDTGGVRFRVLDDGEAFTDDSGPLDDRRVAQKQHDALATALFAAAASGTLPTIGGAAPTLVVSVREEDLVEAKGWAHVDGVDEPLPIGAAHRVACAGVIQRVAFGENGAILRLGTEERVFNRHQRRAIALRDGGCIIPGCGVPAAWCEIHHVVDHAKGGPTHTSNGVLLCWYHHRFHEGIGWRIRMRNGVPEVRAPGWFDAYLVWRPVTKSVVRLTERIARRT